MTDAPPLKIEHLVKYYGTMCAVNDVSFEINKGEIFGLLGPNGAGKTTIISSINTLETATSGSVKVFGYDVEEYPKTIKSFMGCVPQELINHGFFNVEEILKFHSGYHGLLNNKEQIEYLIDKLALQSHRHKRIKELSGGLKRRLLIAKALVHKPKLLLLDEPTAGVDIELRETLWNFVKELKSEGTSILLTTHYLEEAEHLCDRVGFINLGVLCQTGRTENLIKDLTYRDVYIDLKEPVTPFSHHFLVSQHHHSLHFRLPSNNNIGDLMAELPFDIRDIGDLTIREGKLEDAFKAIVGANNGH